MNLNTKNRFKMGKTNEIITWKCVFRV